MALDAVANFIKVTVSTGYGSSDTTIVLSSGGSSMPAAPFNVTWWNITDYPDPSDDPNKEIVRVTNVTGNTLTVTRGQEGTSASTKNAAAKTYLMMVGITAKMITDISAAIAAVIVGYRTTTAYFTTIGNDTAFTITPPTGSVASVNQVIIGSQSFSNGDFNLSGNTVNLTVAYSGPAGAPVIINYNY